MKPAHLPRVSVEGHEVALLSDGWEAAASEPGVVADASGLADLDWLPATVPGGAAEVLSGPDVPRWDVASASVDECDWWFRRRLRLAPVEADEQLVLVFEGLATVAEVYLNGRRIAESDSMFEALAVDVGALVGEDDELVVRFRALAPLLRVSRRPRARWRTRLVADSGLRFFRTMLMGRAPGFPTGPPLVGPWRPVRVERRRALTVRSLDLRPRIRDDAGVLGVKLQLEALGAPAPATVTVELEGRAGTHRLELALDREGDVFTAQGELSVGEVARWWPHTHGEPVLYSVRLLVHRDGETLAIDGGRVGFRELDGGERLEEDGLRLLVNGVAVFARGVVWTPLEFADVAPSPAALRETLESIRAAGMNMVRIPGVAAYESETFHDLCDELGILVWQDFMFANLDYPESDADFLDTVAREVRAVLAAIAGRPSLAVVCGSAEIAQQVAMLGLDPQLANGPLFGELIPGLVRDAELDAVYVPSTPWGGDLPFRPDRGTAHYWGVGGYLRPLKDARLADVRFAAECLAFGNVPEQAALGELAEGPAAESPSRRELWKAGVPRDVGAAWDADDVRDHYLAELFDVDPAALSRGDRERYVELSREVTGEVMAEVLGEWRRGRSACGGALVHWLRDMRPGAGWGLLDHRGQAKAAYHHVRRVLAPVAVWSTDEGLGGIAVHAANDGPAALAVRLRVALYRDWELAVGEAAVEFELPPHGVSEHNVESLLGRFADVSWAYRFGPAAQDVVVLSLERPARDGGELLSQAFRLPAGRPLARETQEHLGLCATVSPGERGVSILSVRTRRFAYGVRVQIPGFDPADDAFSLEPGGERRIALRPTGGEHPGADGSLTALNLSGRVPIMFANVQ